VEPGYHLNKKHWISLYGTDDITPELVTDLITDSWNLVVDKLPEKRSEVDSASLIVRLRRTE